MSDRETLNFTDKRAVPCSDRALSIADAIIKVLETKKKLKKAIKDIPDYTGHLVDEQFYQDEQQDYYDACSELENALNFK